MFARTIAQCMNACASLSVLGIRIKTIMFMYIANATVGNCHRFMQHL